MSGPWKNLFRRLSAEATPTTTADSMRGVNGYWRKAQPHEARSMVGGMWDEIGTLQIQFLKNQGLRPHHTLIDIGCGCLRGGVHFVRYLELGKYYGIDINQSLIDAGVKELEKAGIADRKVQLRTTDKFAMASFGQRFDYGIGISLFTHLFANHIVRCLVEARKVMKPTSRFFFSFFEAPHSAHLEEIVHSPGGKVSKYDSDPFHYSIEEMEWFAKVAGLRMILIGDWGHPRGQQMVCFTLS